MRKLIQKTGFDFHRYRKIPDKLIWLKLLNIKTIFDIGANVGQFSEEIRKELPNAFIYSFEPIKESFDELNKRMGKDRNFKSFHFALGNKKETVTMNKNSYTPSSSILKMSLAHKEIFPHTKNSKPEEIEIKKLDDVASNLYLEKEILIKADTQGYEDKVIEGGTETFKKAKAVLIENSFIKLYENQPLFADIYEILKKLGFSYRGSIHQKLDPKSGWILFEDSIFIRN